MSSQRKRGVERNALELRHVDRSSWHPRWILTAGVVADRENAVDETSGGRRIALEVAASAVGVAAVLDDRGAGGVPVRPPPRSRSRSAHAGECERSDLPAIVLHAWSWRGIQAVLVARALLRHEALGRSVRDREARRVLWLRNRPIWPRR